MSIPNISEIIVPGSDVDMTQFLGWATGIAGAVSSRFTSGTSTSSVTIGSGNVNFVIADATFGVGARVRASDNANPEDNWVEGVVTAITSTTYTINVDLFLGSGTIAAWTISPAGEPGNIAKGEETIGIPSGTALADGGSTAIANTTWIYKNPAQNSGYLTSVRIRAAGAGVVYVKRFTKSGSVYSQVGASIPLSVVSGDNSFTAANFGKVSITAGQYIGFWSGPSNVRFTASSTGDSGGYDRGTNYNNDTDVTIVGSSTTNRFQFSATWATGDLANVQSDVNKIIGIENFADAGTQRIGIIDTPVTGTAISRLCFVFGNRVLKDGAIKGITCYGLTAGTVSVRRYTRSSSTFTEVARYTIKISTGLNVLTQNEIGLIPVSAGEYIGFYELTGVIAFVAATGNGSGYFRTLVNNVDVTGFTDSTGPVNTNRLQIGFDVGLGLIHRSTASTSTDAAEGVGYIQETIKSAKISASGTNVTATVVVDQDYTETTVTATLPITATTGTKVRYDTIYLNSLTNALAIADGTERTSDATYFIPALDSYKIPIANIRTASGVSSISETWPLTDGIHRSIRDAVDLDYQRSRRLLPNLMRKIAFGEQIYFVAMGDSIISLRSDSGDSGTTPNGAVRDRATATDGEFKYLGGYYDADVLDDFPLYTAVQLGRADDSAGQVHTRFGYIWEMIASLEARGYRLGTDLFYDNFGRAGYHSGGAWDSGAPTAWLNAVTALKSDCVILGFGMNERGSADTESRMINIVNTIKDTGTEVIIIGVQRPRAPESMADWQYTNRVLRRVANYTNVAHLPMTHIYDDRFIGALGIASIDVCAANQSNHPGIREHFIIGRELSRLVLG